MRAGVACMGNLHEPNPIGLPYLTDSLEAWLPNSLTSLGNCNLGCVLKHSTFMSKITGYAI